MARRKSDVTVAKPKDKEAMSLLFPKGELDLNEVVLQVEAADGLPAWARPDLCNYMWMPGGREFAGSAPMTNHKRALMNLILRHNAGGPVAPENHPDAPPSEFTGGMYRVEDVVLWYVHKGFYSKIVQGDAQKDYVRKAAATMKVPVERLERLSEAAEERKRRIKKAVSGESEITFDGEGESQGAFHERMEEVMERVDNHGKLSPEERADLDRFLNTVEAPPPL